MYELPYQYDRGIIKYVKLWAKAKTSRPPSTDTDMKLVVNDSDNATPCSTAYESPSQYLTDSWRTLFYLWAKNPDSDDAWDWSDINDLLIGVKAKTSSNITSESLTLRPNASGAHEDLSSVGCTSNYQCVDDSVLDESTYLYTDYGIYKYDSYNLENHGTATGTITSVTVFAYAAMRVDVEQTSYLRLRLRTHGNDFTLSSNVVSGLSYQLFSATATTNPFTGAAWTWAEIDDLQAGIGLKYYTKCSMVYVVVNYENTASPEVQVTQCKAEIGYTPSSATCFLTKPEEISTDHKRNTKMFNFWNGNREVYDYNRNGKSIVLRGTEYQEFGTVTEEYEFDSYDAGTVWETDPDRMVDGTTGTYAYTTIDDDTQLLDSHTGSDVDYGSCKEISKVEVRVYASPTAAFPDASRVQLQPVFVDGNGTIWTGSGQETEGWTEWHDITSDTNAPPTWHWSDFRQLQVNVIGNKIQDYGVPKCHKVELRVTYKTLTPCCKIQCVRGLARNGGVVTIDDLRLEYFNGVYRIRQFGWNKISEKPEQYDWILELEDAEP